MLTITVPFLDQVCVPCYFVFGYVIFKECSFRAVSWVRLGFLQVRMDLFEEFLQVPVPVRLVAASNKR